jgi:hypothetical protein
MAGPRAAAIARAEPPGPAPVSSATKPERSTPNQSQAIRGGSAGTPQAKVPLKEQVREAKQFGPGCEPTKKSEPQPDKTLSCDLAGEEPSFYGAEPANQKQRRPNQAKLHTFLATGS